jgi:hypothetical protein
MVRFTQRPLYPRNRTSGADYTKKVDGLHSRSARFWKEKNLSLFRRIQCLSLGRPANTPASKPTEVSPRPPAVKFDFIWLEHWPIEFLAVAKVLVNTKRIHRFQEWIQWTRISVNFYY